MKLSSSNALRMNTIITIGYLGFRRCYLNVSMEEAIRRYTESEGETPSPDLIDTTDIEDEWCSYDGAYNPV